MRPTSPRLTLQLGADSHPSHFALGPHPPTLVPSLTSARPSLGAPAPTPSPLPGPRLPLLGRCPLPPPGRASAALPLTAPAPCAAAGPPSAPRDLQYSLSRSPLALRLRWLPPADSGGRSDVTYSLLCLRCGREGPAGVCEPCEPRVAFVPRQAGLRERAATLLHLRPGARYTVRVAALNGVSGPAAAAGATYAQVTVSTGPGGKAAPRVRGPLCAPPLPHPSQPRPLVSPRDHPHSPQPLKGSTIDAHATANKRPVSVQETSDPPHPRPPVIPPRVAPLLEGRGEVASM